ncbi:MAG: diaminopimelate decarboxylase [Candidatus Omnitrophica bacterium]|nr:diaminopimelate decarboxylase [Candidatus Omnitrophota bacterium]
MHRFSLRKDHLWCEQVPVSKVAGAVGTPLYLYSYGTLLDHYKKLQAAFKSIKPLICFSMKANSNLALCRALAKAGAGFDVVSGGELRKILGIGADPKKIVFASVGKTEGEIEAAVRAGILCFNAESVQEVQRIQAVCQRLGRRQMVILRLNPDVDPHTHAFITTGSRANKFGMDVRTVESILRRAAEFPDLELGGLHVHIGSQILKAKPFKEGITKALQVADRARRYGVSIRWLNIGGGLGIVYRRETPQTAAAYAKAVLPLLKGTGLRIILEPGRFIVGNSGILLTKVLYLKESHGKQFAIVDAGMNDLIRPSLYGAYHEIVPVIQNQSRSRRRVRYDVVGPVCESGDFLAKDRALPPLKPGDLLAVMSAGAYGFTMSSNYNSRPRAAEVLVKGKIWTIVRKRESYQDLVRNERIPAFLR